MSIEPFEVGALRALAPLERTGDAEVWRALHVPSGVPVALKFLPRGTDDDRALARRRMARLQGIAALDHPHVARLLGVGRVDTEAAARSRGRVREGSVWVASELASGGGLLEHPPAGFDALRVHVVALLSGLAHAHAHGVLHLGLKPSNVLMAGRRDARPGLKLVDPLLERGVNDATVRSDAGAAGVAYMAPEQLEGESHALGPWTDLYAVGCLAWTLATGAPPYVRDTAVATARAALGGVRPAFVPRVVCPDAFLDWLGALLARDPTARPRHASDALLALLELETPALFDDDDDELTANMDDPFVSPEEPTHHGFDHEAVAAGTAPTGGPTVLPPPATVGPWQAPREPCPALDGAGVGLFGLRVPPLAGRDGAQQTLWDTLRWVHGAKRARTVVVRGTEGSGRTALAAWFTARAAELGVASAVWVRDEPRSLAAGVMRWLGVRDLSPADRGRALELRLDAATARSVHALAGGTLSATGRAGVVRRLLHGASARRPVIVVVDDAEHQLEILQLVGDLEAFPGPVVFLVLVGDAGPQDDGASLLLERIEGPVLELAPLEVHAARRWLTDGLGFAAFLAEQAIGRSTSPLYLQQLIAGWATEGRLRPSDEGLEAPEGVPPLPVGLDELWLLRVDDVLESMEPAAGWDLHVAATLGRSFRTSVWHTACDDPEGEGRGWDPAGVARREALVDALWGAGLVRMEGRRVAFVHPTLRTALVAQSEAMGRKQWLHHACAQALVLHEVDDGARLGTHLLHAGEPEGAVAPLLDAVTDLARRRPTDALQVLGLAEEAAHEAGLPPTSLASVALLVTRAEVHLAARERPEALRWAGWAERAVEHHGAEAPAEDQPAWQEHLARALRVAFEVFMGQDEPLRAVRVLDRLEQVVRRLGAPVAVGEVLLARARWSRATGQPEKAAPLLAEAMASFKGQVVAQAKVRLDWATLALEMGLQADAERTLDEALAQADVLEPERELWGRLLALRGELALHSGHPSATTWLADGAAVQASTGADASRTRLLEAVARGVDDPVGAAASVREVAPRVRDRSRLRGLAALAEAIAEARVRRWPAVHDAVARYAARPVEPHPTIAWLAGRLVEECDDAGFPQLAERVRERPVG